MKLVKSLGTRWVRLSGVAVAMTAALFVAYAHSTQAKPQDERERTVSGTIERFTTAPRGEVDGAELSDGTSLHWPPHTGERMSQLLERGNRVRAVGRDETGPMGDDHFEVTRLTNVSSGESIDIADLPPRPKLEPRKRGEREIGETRTESRLRALEDRIDRLEEQLARQPRDR